VIFKTKKRCSFPSSINFRPLLGIMEVHRVNSIDSIDLVDFLVEDHDRLTIAPGAGTEEESLVSEFKQMELRGELKPEPLLMEDKQRFVLFPIKHTDVSRCLGGLSVSNCTA